MSFRSKDQKGGFIWATRGLNWGFRFLRRGGFEDPLGVYEEVFADVSEQPEIWHRSRGRVALRFPDPLERRDAAGRVIPHDFVLLGAWADGIDSFEDGRTRLWREVADEFERVWEKESPPQSLR